jgi:hypothetical protein
MGKTITKYLEFWEARIKLTAPRELWTFVELYFVPFFELRNSSSAPLICSVDIHVRKPSVRREQFTGPFPIDDSGGPLRCSGYRHQTPGRLSVLMCPMNALVEKDLVTNRVTVSAESVARLKVPLIRVIEDSVLPFLERKGYITLHASGVVAGKQATLVVGNKRAGKTSTLCALMSDYHCSKLCNDMAILGSRGRRVRARGWPSFMKIEVGTVASNGDLSHLYPEKFRKFIHQPQQLWSGKLDKVSLFGGDAAQMFGCGILPEADIAHIVCSEFSTSEVGMERSNRPMRRVLRDNFQGVFNPKHHNWLAVPQASKQAVRLNAERIARRLNGSTEIWELRWAPSLPEWFNRIPGLRPHNRSLAQAADAKPKSNPALPLVFNDI